MVFEKLFPFKIKMMEMPLNKIYICSIWPDLIEILTELDLGGELQYFTKFRQLKIKIKSLGSNYVHA